MSKFSNIKVLNIASTDRPHDTLDQMLRRAGVENVFRTSDMEQAFGITRESKIDIALVDDNPPGLDGIEASGAIRLGEDSPDCYLPIIFLSRSNSIGRATQAVEASVHMVKSQPFPAKRLTANIAKCLSNPPKFVCSDVYF
jgi:CheY-like chemotaxis protein